MELEPWLCETRKKPPGIHSTRSVPVNFPPGPIGPGFTSPVNFQLPVKYARFLCSGPGLGICGGVCATASKVENNKTANATMSALFIMSLLLCNLTSLSNQKTGTRRCYSRPQEQSIKWPLAFFVNLFPMGNIASCYSCSRLTCSNLLLRGKSLSDSHHQYLLARACRTHGISRHGPRSGPVSLTPRMA